ncbi:ThiF family adenylyltransferase [Streptococcus ovuberis]|uniref:THIF-type NAD/FAD binding fold domain-containing protein n=1 Tax=Streptococcus ovuberis TaxID=1936207 RepID=A0A7X6MWK3_9STRE|nr:ThiF family adenylyltransferase [Streptococcus ovuberis]NKZ19720.1 hypothetical protein [Streptococcus ovuberis]
MPDNLKTLESAVISADIVINCTDYPDINTTSTWISNLCMKLNKPHIIGGGYSGHTGIIGPTIIPNQTVCWECINSSHKEFLSKSSQNVIINMRKSAGANVILSSFVANIQAWECIKVLTNISSPTVINRRGFLDVNTLSIEWVTSKARANCDYCKHLFQVSEKD